MSKYKVLFTDSKNRNKILLTVLALFIYRFGCMLPVPFINKEYLSALTDNNMLSYLSLMSGGALGNSTFFALGVMPFINASIIIQLLMNVIPKLEQLKGAGKKGQETIERISKLLGLAFSLAFSFLYYMMLKSAGALKYTTGKDGLFVALVVIVIYMTGATIVSWLCTQIDTYGIGNGMSMIIFVGIIQNMSTIFTQLGLSATEVDKTNFVLSGTFVTTFLLCSLVFIVFCANSQYEISLHYSGKKEKANYANLTEKLPMKILMAGVMPVIFASAITSIPNVFLSFVQNPNSFIYKVLVNCTYSNPIYCAIYLVFIALFNKFYVAIQFDVAQMAENLRKNNGVIQGIRPGKETEEYLKRTLSRVSMIGGFVLVIITAIPMAMEFITGITFQLGGTSILIVVQVGLEILNTLKEMTKSKVVSRFI